MKYQKNSFKEKIGGFFFLSAIVFLLIIFISPNPAFAFEYVQGQTRTLNIPYTDAQNVEHPAGGQVTLYDGGPNGSYFQDATGNKYTIYNYNGGYNVEPVPNTLDLRAAAAGYEEVTKSYFTGTSQVTITDAGQDAIKDGYLYTDGSMTNKGITLGTPNITGVTPPVTDSNGVSEVTPDPNATYSRGEVSSNGSVQYSNTKLTEENSTIITGPKGTFVDYLDPVTGQHTLYELRNGTTLEPLSNQNVTPRDLAAGTVSNTQYVPGSDSNVPPVALPPGVAPGNATVKTDTSSVGTSATVPKHGGIVPECDGSKTDASGCGFQQFLALISSIITYLLWIATPIAAVAFFFAGYLYLTAGGNTGKIEEAHSIFWSALVGIIIMLSAWLLINTIVTSLVADKSFMLKF